MAVCNAYFWINGRASCLSAERALLADARPAGRDARRAAARRGAAPSPFPQLPPDFDTVVEANGIDDTIYPTEARRLEVGRFASANDARTFEAEFRSYLVPGLLDAPELAEVVARQNGLRSEWVQMGYREIVELMGGAEKLVREAEGWHPQYRSHEREL